MRYTVGDTNVYGNSDRYCNVHGNTRADGNMYTKWRRNTGDLENRNNGPAGTLSIRRRL
jgi:hypothetical protein